MVRAGFYTFTATNTFIRAVHLLWLVRNAFGIMTPEAGERTTFEKNGDADARAIVYGITFDIEYQRLLHYQSFVFISSFESQNQYQRGSTRQPISFSLYRQRKQNQKKATPMLLPACGRFLPLRKYLTRLQNSPADQTFLT